MHEVLVNFAGVLLSDGYAAYERFAAQTNEVVHGQCWSHTRRQFLKAGDIELALVSTALSLVQQLYAEEAQLAPKLIAPHKRLRAASAALQADRG